MVSSDSITRSKICTRCKCGFPVTSEYFKPVKHHKDGFSSHCRYCIREANKAYQLTRRLKPEIQAHEIEYSKEYHSRPEVKRRKSEYGKTHRALPEIKDRRKQYTHEYERREDRKLSRRTRSVMTRVKRRCAEGKHTRQDVEILLKTQKGLCWWCGKPHGDNYEVDHRIPLSRGGTNWANNLCISCFECNRHKHNKLPHEWNGRLL